MSRLAAAGTVLMGKTNTHELGGGVTTINPFFGTTHNPRDLARIAGGSSGGSAAAVAARLALVATGSDTGGSVRIPAALLRLRRPQAHVRAGEHGGAARRVSHVRSRRRPRAHARRRDAWSSSRPRRRHRRQPRGRPAAGAQSSSADCALTDAYRAARARGVRGLRVGVPRAYFFDALDPGVARAVERALGAARCRRRTRARRRPPGHRRALRPDVRAHCRERDSRHLRDRMAARPEAFSKDFAAVFAGAAPAAAAVAAARDARASSSSARSTARAR